MSKTKQQLEEMSDSVVVSSTRDGRPIRTVSYLLPFPDSWLDLRDDSNVVEVIYDDDGLFKRFQLPVNR